ncbi:DNA polymerase II [compost metagenome]
MKFLPHRKKEETMLVNVIHHRERKDTDWKDYLDIVYKDLKSGEKFVETIESPKIEFYMTKEEHRNYNHNRDFIPLSQCDKHETEFKNVAFYIAKQLGPQAMAYIKQCQEQGNRSLIRNMHKSPYVFGSDYDIENWYRIQWLLHNNNDEMKPITKQYTDIEVDSIDIEGFPRNGNCPINAITIVDEESKTSFTFLLRNDKNPQIQEFEETIDEFIEELHDDFDETYGHLDYKFYMYDDERQLIIDFFKLVNTLKRDFLLIWNGGGFDIPFIIDRLRELGLDPVDVMTHKDFKIKECFFHQDKDNYAIANKGDYLKLSSYTSYLDQMVIYAGNRKGQGEKRSYALNYVGQEELGDTKLDYSEEANIKTLPYVNFKRFVKYNIKDVLLQLGIERRTNDVDSIYQRAYSNATKYEKIFKQTVQLGPLTERSVMKTPLTDWNSLRASA